jgi:hypothetical protein
VGQCLALTGQVGLGAVPQHRQEKVIHAGEVVVHQGGLDAGLRRHPPRGRRGIAFLEHDLGGRSDKRVSRLRLPATP